MVLAPDTLLGGKQFARPFLDGATRSISSQSWSMRAASSLVTGRWLTSSEGAWSQKRGTMCARHCEPVFGNLARLEPQAVTHLLHQSGRAAHAVRDVVREEHPVHAGRLAGNES